MAPESIVFDTQKLTSCVLLTMFVVGDERALVRAREDMHLPDACTFDEWLVVSYRPRADTVTCFKDLGMMVQVTFACCHLLSSPPWPLSLTQSHSTTLLCSLRAALFSISADLLIPWDVCVSVCLSVSVCVDAAGCMPGEDESASATCGSQRLHTPQWRVGSSQCDSIWREPLRHRRWQLPQRAHEGPGQPAASSGPCSSSSSSSCASCSRACSSACSSACTASKEIRRE